VVQGRRWWYSAASVADGAPHQDHARCHRFALIRLQICVLHRVGVIFVLWSGGWPHSHPAPSACRTPTTTEDSDTTTIFTFDHLYQYEVDRGTHTSHVMATFMGHLLILGILTNPLSQLWPTLKWKRKPFGVALHQVRTVSTSGMAYVDVSTSRHGK